MPLAERYEPVANPDIVGNRFSQRDLRHEVFIGQIVEALVFRIVHFLEAIANDSGDEGNGFDRRESALKFAADMTRFQRARAVDHRNQEGDIGH